MYLFSITVLWCTFPFKTLMIQESHRQYYDYYNNNYCCFCSKTYPEDWAGWAGILYYGVPWQSMKGSYMQANVIDRYRILFTLVFSYLTATPQANHRLVWHWYIDTYPTHTYPTLTHPIHFTTIQQHCHSTTCTTTLYLQYYIQQDSHYRNRIGIGLQYAANKINVQ